MKAKRIIEIVLVLTVLSLTVSTWHHFKKPREVGQAEQDRAMELVREAGRILYPATPDGSPPTFDPAAALNPGERPSRAIAKYSEALEIWPECVPALVFRSAQFDTLGEHERAETDARYALTLSPKAHNYTMLAMPFEGAEKREILREGMEVARPDSYLYGHLWYDIANSYFYDGNFRSQAKELEKLCEFAAERETGGLYFDSLGSAYRILGEFDKAGLAFKKGLPDSADSLVRLRMEQGDAAAALTCLEQHRASLEPDDALIYGALIKALDGQPVPEIEQAYQAVLRQGENNMFGVDGFSAGVLLLVQGQKADADYHFFNFIMMIGSNPTEWGVTLKWRAEMAKTLMKDGLPKTNGQRLRTPSTKKQHPRRGAVISLCRTLV